MKTCPVSKQIAEYVNQPEAYECEECYGELVQSDLAIAEHLYKCSNCDAVYTYDCGLKFLGDYDEWLESAPKLFVNAF